MCHDRMRGSKLLLRPPQEIWGKDCRNPSSRKELTNVYLCDHSKQCLRPMLEDWEEQKASESLGGHVQPGSSCFQERSAEGSATKKDVQLVKICNEEGVLINAVPQACFRAHHIVNPDNKQRPTRIGATKRYISGTGFAYEFIRASQSDFDRPKTSLDHPGMDNCEVCKQPLRALWNSTVRARSSDIASMCPSHRVEP
mmetsp:Transcript_86374/g.200882  ORF Transcript_86374/g.200882 Transcript_86374/m.200882 type:complete len:198 (-) Transcript_86374:183-776(-)